MEFLPEVVTLVIGLAAGFVGGLVFPYKVQVEPIAKTVLVAEAQLKFNADEHVHIWGSILNDGLGWRCTECNTLRSGNPMPPKPPREITNG